MIRLLDYLIYPAQTSIEFCPELTYKIRLQTQQEELLTSGSSFENACKMASSILIDMSFAQAFEESIPPSAAFTVYSDLVKSLKAWLAPLPILKDVPDKEERLNFNETFIKASYLCQIVNLITVADHISTEQKDKVQDCINRLLKQPLDNLNPPSVAKTAQEKGETKDSVQTSKPKKGAKSKSTNSPRTNPDLVLYLFFSIKDYAQQNQDSTLIDACNELIELTAKLPNMFVRNHKLKKRTPLQAEFAVLIPLNATLKFILCNAILTHKVKLKDLADDLVLSKDELLEKLDFYSSTPVVELNDIFHRLGISPDCSFE